MKWDLQDDVRWKVPVPGKGWSSPIVHDGRIFLTTAVPSEEDPPKRQSLRALCLDAAKGETLWDVEVFVKQMGPDEKINPKNSFASPTPITDGEHVFVHFGPDGTACLDRDGKRIWANDRLRYDSVHGAGGSPVFAGSRLVLVQEATEQSRKSYDMLRKARGPEHPDTLTAMTVLAQAYLDAGQGMEKLPLIEEAWRLSKDVLGLEHRDTLEVMNKVRSRIMRLDARIKRYPCSRKI